MAIYEGRIDGYYIRGPGVYSAPQIYIRRHVDKIFKPVLNILEIERQEAYADLVSRYQKNYIMHSSLTEKEANLLDMIINTNNKNKDIYNLMDEELKTMFKNTKDLNKINKLTNYIQSANLSNKKTTHGKIAQQDLDNLFKIISSAASLIEPYQVQQGAGYLTPLEAVINQCKAGGKNKNYTDIEKVYNRLKPNFKLVNAEKMDDLVRYIQTMANNIKNPNKEKNLKNVINGHLKVILNDTIGEQLMTSVYLTSLGIAIDEISLNLANTGGQTLNIINNQKLKNEIDNAKSLIGHQTYDLKTDVGGYYAYVKIAGKEILVQEGWSVKFIDVNSSGEASIVSESKIEHRLNQLISQSKHPEDLRWAVYNSIASFSKDNRTLYDYAKTIFVNKFFDGFLSGIGVSSDFSQFIIINGEMISVLDMIRQILPRYSGSDKDEIHATFTGVQQVTKLMPPESEAPNFHKAYMRCKDQSQTLRKDVGFSMKIHMNKMSRALK